MRISDWSSDVCASDLFDATDRLKLRAAFISGAARPNFVNQRATVTINDAVGLQTVTGGNPALKPERAFGGDASVEWYFAPSSLLSASGFYRKVKDTLFDSTSIVGDDRYNLNGLDRSESGRASVGARMCQDV